MAKRDHTSTLRGELTGQGLNIPDSEIYAGQLHEGMADACITMRETGGPVADDVFGSKNSIQQPRVQVLIRHDDKTLGKSDADDCWQILHDADPSGYSRPTMVQSSPIALGPDDDHRHRWSINVELFIWE